MGRRKTQKIIKTGPKNVTTGLCPECQTIGRISIIGQVARKEQNVLLVIRNLTYNQNSNLPITFLRRFLFFIT